MNLRIKIFSLFFFLLLITVRAFSQDCKVNVVIKTNNPACGIIIDNNNVGKGEANIELSPGNHTLKIISDVKQWNNLLLTKTISIDNCDDEKQLTYNFNGQVYIDSDPQNAEVFSGDSSLGFTPLFISDNISEISLKKNNYSSRSVALKDIAGTGTINLNFTGEQGKESFYTKPIFKFLLGGAVILGAATAYFKIKADRAYKNYQSTGDKTFLDDTHKYDLASGITFGALQINLGYFIYKFLSD